MQRANKIVTFGPQMGPKRHHPARTHPNRRRRTLKHVSGAAQLPLRAEPARNNKSQARARQRDAKGHDTDAQETQRKRETSLPTTREQ